MVVNPKEIKTAHEDKYRDSLNVACEFIEKELLNSSKFPVDICMDNIDTIVYDHVMKLYQNAGWHIEVTGRMNTCYRTLKYWKISPNEKT